MIDPETIINSASQLPLEPIFLGGLLVTTGLGTVFSWQSSRQLKLMAQMFEHEGYEDETDETSFAEDGVPAQTPPFQWFVDGATRQGKVRSENQDAFVIWQDRPHSAFLIVCDGAGGVEGGGEAALSAANACLESFKATEGLDITPEQRLSLAIDHARKVSDTDGLTGITTAILAYVEGDQLTYATLGDGALAVIWPDGMIGQHLVPHHALGQPDNIITGFVGHGCSVPPRIGNITLEPGSTIMLMSDGASDLFPYGDFAIKREEFNGFLKCSEKTSLADHFLSEIEAARDPETQAYLHHDNMTLILAHLVNLDEDRPMATDNMLEA